ncbi:peroxidase 47 [Aristolochia californica]|uniref:peroxidase 47 n=1 Tax=Aristolochia californica TaxID=171875 RepID=UPI0035D752C3
MAAMMTSLLILLTWSLNVLAYGEMFAVNALSMDYYDMRCPLADMIVRSVVNRALQKDPTLSGPLLRMHFHDCFVQGCDGSILIDSTKKNTAEKDSPANLSLRGYEIIDEAKDELEDRCPGVVSCADIVAMAAREAVFFTGGPFYDIPKGRKDGRRSKIEDTINLPPPTLNSSELIKIFGQHGFSVAEMVALSGGHTLGVAKCASFKNRLSNFDSTHNVDPSMNTNMAAVLQKTCSGGDNSEVPFDRTRTTFDNAYYNALQSGTGLLTSDQTLFSSPRTRRIVYGYAMNQAMFFFDFQQAMVKMSQLDIKEDEEGEVRLNCRRTN